jgi:hypothetical protein
VCKGRLVVRVAFQIKVAFVREQIRLRFAYLLSNLLLLLNWLFWVNDNCLNVVRNQCSIFDNADFIPTKEVAKLSNNSSVAKLLCI